MESHYIIESECAVIFLSIILCAYLQIIYSGTSSNKKGLLRYCYMTTASGVIDVFVSIVLAEGSSFSAEAKYFCSVLWQIAACGVYFMFMRYIACFGPESPGKKRMLYVQNIFMGIFLYLQLVGHFTGANYAITPDGTLTTGALWGVLTIGFLWLWSVWTWFCRMLDNTDGTGSGIPRNSCELHHYIGERVLLLLPS